jgi:hypothetical protein
MWFRWFFLIQIHRQIYRYIRVCKSEVHKVPEPANLVRRKFWKISLLAENFDQNLRVENTETFLSHVYFILPENFLYTLFSQKQLILTEHFLYILFSLKQLNLSENVLYTFFSHKQLIIAGNFAVHIILTESFLYTIFLSKVFCRDWPYRKMSAYCLERYAWKYSIHTILTENFLQRIGIQTKFCFLSRCEWI